MLYYFIFDLQIDLSWKKNSKIDHMSYFYKELDIESHYDMKCHECMRLSY